jgi:hypothetical protein
MNSWKLNSHAQYHLRVAIADSLKIPLNDVYKTVKGINHKTIETKDGKKYELVLKEIT